MSEGNPGGGTAPAKKSGSSAMIRQIVLVLFMLVALGALLYDRFVARPSAEKAYTAMHTVFDEQSSAPADKQIATKEKIREITGKEPGAKEDKGHYVLETYYWTSGLPWYSYKVIVLYDKNPSGEVLAQQNWLNADPEPTDLPAPPVVPGGDAGDDDDDAGDDDDSSGS